ncbi:hypothetical protein OIU77_018501 [Salix suchowensis]|uniref:Uncharacterized protein n=1 Tax=Salix suchowensis TaxID=1278906 RepID=A0ABQ9CFS1_9ROSI|nr:hypothetical protein OIU77_018501 [Salix suchowensis]
MQMVGSQKRSLGFIELYNLEMLLLQAPNQSSNLPTDSRMLSQLLSQKLVPTKDHNPIKRGYQGAILLRRGQLEKNLGHFTVDCDLCCSVHMEIHPI